MAEVISSQAIGGTAVFRDQNLKQEAAVPLQTTANSLLKLPFETAAYHSESRWPTPARRRTL